MNPNSFAAVSDLIKQQTDHCFSKALIEFICAGTTI